MDFSETKNQKTLEKGVFGPHRRERIAFLAENGQARLRRSKAGPRHSKPVDFNEKGSKNTPKEEGRKCVWTAQARADRVFSEIRRPQAWALKNRRERIAVLAELCKSPQISPDLHQVGGQSLSKGLNI